jgi:hypothetical protein
MTLQCSRYHFAVQQGGICTTASGLSNAAGLFCKTAELTAAFVLVAAKDHHTNKMEEIMVLILKLVRMGVFA